MNLLVRVYLGLLVWFYLLAIGLTLVSKITFGAGLGDLAYVMLMGVVVFMAVGVYSLTRKTDFSRQKMAGFTVMIIGTFTMGYTIYEFTLGRNSEYPWNGCIIYGCGRY